MFLRYGAETKIYRKTGNRYTGEFKTTGRTGRSVHHGQSQIE